MNLGNRILLVLVPLIGIPFAVAGWLVYHQLSDDARTTLRNQQAMLLEHTHHLVQHELDTARANAAALAENELVGRYLLTEDELDRYTLLQPALLRLLQGYQRVFPQYYEIRVLLPDGYEDARSTLRPLPNRTEDEAQTPQFQEMAASDDPSWSTLFVDPDNGRLAVLASRRIRLTDQAVDPLNTTPSTRGYLVITSDLPFLAGPAAHQHPAPEGQVLVVDADGRIVSPSDDARFGTLLGDVAGSGSRAGEAVGGEQRTAPTEPGGLVMTRDLGGGFSAVVTVPVRGIAATGRQVGWMVATATLLAILLCAAALFAMIRRLVLQPISALGEATRQISQGNLLAPVPGGGSPEIRALADAFRSMGTSLNRSAEHAHHLAYHDALTGLPNRTLLLEQLESAVAAARRNDRLLGVVFLDLDDFKQVNDTLGHHRGDQLLVAVSRILSQCLRAQDLIARPGPGDGSREVVARLGGDEFTILLPAIRHERDAGQIAERVIHSLSSPITVDGHRLHVGASIGITLFPTDGPDAETLLKNADIAMYHAKSRGKNNFQFFSPAMNTRVTRRLSLEHRIRDALDSGDLSLVYQPIVETATGRMAGVEALLRWVDPDIGPVSPSEIVAVAEECGLIFDLGQWVLKEACRQSRAWQSTGPDEIFTSVNVSGIQLGRGDLSELVEHTLSATGLEARLLQLEVTESSLVEVTEKARRDLARVSELGVQISLDDFGAGYSSLGHLRRLPIRHLKIDRGFVMDLDQEGGDQPLVTAIITLAHSLGLGAVAVGVETPQQLELLRDQGCDRMQGWLLGRPVPAEAIAARLREGYRWTVAGTSISQ
ncbi:MAG: EAL domain-containing protein [Chromatiales bacterium]|jgi:diguanylate cyclase (GGDEF)-like protein